MSLTASNTYYPYFPYAYTSPFYSSYYSNSTPIYQPPISYNNSFVRFNEQTRVQYAVDTRSNKKHRRRHLNVNVKNSDDSIPTSSDYFKIIKTHRFDAQRHTQHQQIGTHDSLGKSSSIFQSIDDNRRLNFSPSVDQYHSTLQKLSPNISNEQLTHLLDTFTFIKSPSDDIDRPHQQLSIVNDILNALIDIHPSTLLSTSKNEFFSIIQTVFIHIIRRWHRLSSLQDDEFLTFRMMTKLTERFITATDDLRLLPLWLTDSTLLEAISNCLNSIATSGNFLENHNKTQFKCFTRLIDAYIHYQQQVNDQNYPNKDLLVQLLDAILRCLTSPQYIHTFANLPVDAKSMTTIEKFFLVKCPAFLTSYNGSRLEQMMENLLSFMLPQYAELFDQLVLLIHQWGRSMFRSVHHLLEMINHGANLYSTNAKLVSSHLSLIGNVLKLVNEPILYNNVHETLSDLETVLMNTAISFLVNMISEPSILAHIKQSQVTSVFLRLTTCAYEPLVFNVYALLAYTTHEEDIKAMHNPGRLLATTIESLRIALNGKREKKAQIEQLLETLKGLVQHDQIKDEIIKQNALPFLLECTKKLFKRSLVLIFEILWCLTFFEEIARTLRASSEFLKRIQTISKDNSNEPLKKAVDGLVWKLIQEPTSLEKVAKQEEEQEAETVEKTATTEIVIGENGTEQIVRTMRPRSSTPSERSYRYDIMISYCHSDKELTYKIHKFLIDQGFKVWLDLDNMYGPAMSAMAEAVENSEFVIMCMSDSYKQSTYCQAEAEYAFKCKRRLIPLIMRQGYKPDGWLGFMIGSRIYVDFGRFDFETACDKLMTEISLQRKQTIPTIIIDKIDHENPVDTQSSVLRSVESKKKPSIIRQSDKPLVKKNIVSAVIKARQAKIDFFRKPINQWTEIDVVDFLSAHRLNQFMPLCEGMNGRGLMELYKLCTSHRLRAFSALKDELKSKNHLTLSLGVYSQFLCVTEEAIKSLSAPPPPPPVPVLPSQPQSQLPPPSPRTIPPRIVSTIPFVPAPARDTSYDFSIISDASPLDTLKMVESYGSQLQRLDYLRRRIANVF